MILERTLVWWRKVHIRMEGKVESSFSALLITVLYLKQWKKKKPKSTYKNYPSFMTTSRKTQIVWLWRFSESIDFAGRILKKSPFISSLWRMSVPSIKPTFNEFMISRDQNLIVPLCKRRKWRRMPYQRLHWKMLTLKICKGGWLSHQKSLNSYGR